MIEGLKIRIGGTELQELCTKRAIYHGERAAMYAQQEESLTQAGVESVMNLSNGDPRERLKTKLREHMADSDEMHFIAAHIVADAQYQLDSNDLSKLGITRRGW